MRKVDRAMMTVSGTPGTGTITLGSAISGAQTFASAGIVDGDYFVYTAVDGTAWEIGWGKYTSSGTTLVRNLTSSSTGSLLNLSSNTVVAIAPAAADVGPGGFRNRVFNGDMQVSQEMGTTALTAFSSGEKYAADGFGLAANIGSATISAQQISINWTGCDARLALRSTVGTSGSMSAGHYCQQLQRIEGTFWRDLFWGTSRAKGVFVDFWAQTSVTGTYGISLTGGSSAQTYLHIISLTANTPTRIVFWVPGPTTGTWATDNTVAVQLNITMGAGSTFQTSTVDAWTAGTFLCTSSTTNLVATASATFDITDVAVYSATSPVPFERLDFDTQLWRAKRYWESSFPYGYPPAQNNAGPNTICQVWNGVGGASSNGIRFEKEKRTTPTVTLFSGNSVGSPTAGSWNYLDNGWHDGGSSNVVSAYVKGFFVGVGGVSTSYTCIMLQGNWTASARL